MSSLFFDYVIERPFVFFHRIKQDVGRQTLCCTYVYSKDKTILKMSIINLSLVGVYFKIIGSSIFLPEITTKTTVTNRTSLLRSHF